MSGEAYKHIGFANFDELAEKIVRKKVPFFHFKVPLILVRPGHSTFLIVHIA